MFRTYICPVSEEESDLDKIVVRIDYIQAVICGYLTHMKQKLTTIELQHILYCGRFMIYMQGLRFLTDFIQNDIYYGSKYIEHNLIRAKNQFKLLECFIEVESELKLWLLNEFGISDVV